jgi:2-phosphosulfolactate phosphatase
MRINVSPVPLEFAAADPGTATVVVDVFRASTTIAVALANGARFVLPAADVEQAMRLAEPYAEGEVLLAGERECQRIEGFELGNSPGDFTTEAVAGKVLIFTTTNGTQAIAAARDSAAVFVGSFVNFSRVAEAVAGFESVTVLCAGNAGRLSLEDFVCAGAMVARLAKGNSRLGDAAIAARSAWKAMKENPARVLVSTEHARRLAGLGFRADLDFALSVDSVPLVPRLRDGRIEPSPA